MDTRKSYSPARSDKYRRGYSPERSNEKRRGYSSARSDEHRRGYSSARSDEYKNVTIDIDTEDIAFIIGRGGATKRKLMRISGARLEVDVKKLRVNISGNEKCIKRAKKYIGLLMTQRRGPISMDLIKEGEEEYSIINVPNECIGFVTGHKGSSLRRVEEEWGSLMFFVADAENSNANSDTKILVIFGSSRARSGTRLSLLSLLEHKTNGSVLCNGKIREEFNFSKEFDGSRFGMENVSLTEAQFKYALGKKGFTRKKIAWASGCITQYIGLQAVFCGTEKERNLAKEYLHLLLVGQNNKGSDQHKLIVENPKSRDDCIVVNLPNVAVGFVTGFKGRSLRMIETTTETFCLVQEVPPNDSRQGGDHDLVIFGHTAKNRQHAKNLVLDKIEDQKHAPRQDQRNESRDNFDEHRYAPRQRIRNDSRDNFDEHRYAPRQRIRNESRNNFDEQRNAPRLGHRNESRDNFDYQRNVPRLGQRNGERDNTSEQGYAPRQRQRKDSRDHFGEQRYAPRQRERNGERDNTSEKRYAPRQHLRNEERDTTSEQRYAPRQRIRNDSRDNFGEQRYAPRQRERNEYRSRPYEKSNGRDAYGRNAYENRSRSRERSSRPYEKSNGRNAYENRSRSRERTPMLNLDDQKYQPRDTFRSRGKQSFHQNGRNRDMNNGMSQNDQFRNENHFTH